MAGQFILIHPIWYSSWAFFLKSKPNAAQMLSIIFPRCMYIVANINPLHTHSHNMIAELLFFCPSDGSNQKPTIHHESDGRDKIKANLLVVIK